MLYNKVVYKCDRYSQQQGGHIKRPRIRSHIIFLKGKSKMKKRILAVLLCLLMVLPLLAACQNTPDVPDDSDSGSAEATNTQSSGDTATPGETNAPSGDSETETKEEVPADYLADYNFNGKTVCMLYWSDYTMQEFEATDDLSDSINSAIYNRNAAVESRLGIKLTFDKTAGNDKKMDDYISKVKSDFSSAQVVYDMYATYSRVAPQLSYKGYTADLMKLEPLDFSKPWWPESLVNECTIYDKLFFCSGDISTNLLWMMIGTFFNKDLLAEYKLDTPYQLVKDGKWTMEALQTMTANTFRELDGEDGGTDGDLYGYSIYSTNIDALGTASGYVIITRDSGGNLILNSDYFGEKMVNGMKSIQEWLNTSTDIYYSSSAEPPRVVFRDARSLFLTDRLFVAAGKDNTSNETSKDTISFNFGIVPNPMWTEDQDGYSTNLGHPFTMYAISRKANNISATAATLELMAAESYRYVTPAVYEVAMKLRYSKDSVDSEMYDYIRNSVKIELGRVMCDCIDTYTASAFRKAVTAKSFETRSYQVKAVTIAKKLTELNEKFKALS